MYPMKSTSLLGNSFGISYGSFLFAKLVAETHNEILHKTNNEISKNQTQKFL